MEELTKNEIIHAVIDGYTSEALGVCHVRGRAVFVPRALLGEEWELRIVKVTAGAVYARGEKLLSPSPARIESDCPHFGKCGGCDTRHMAYGEELRFKLNRVNDALNHIGKQTLHAEEILACEKPEQYRNKGIFAVSEQNGKPVFGFYRERSHELIPVTRCALQSELSCRVAAGVTAFMQDNGIRAFDEASGRGTVRHVFCRQAVHSGDAVACIVAARGFGAKTASLVDALRAACPELSGIVLNVNKARGNTILSGDFYTLWGDACIHDTLCGLRFEIAPQAFYQVNPPQAEKLYEKAMEYAALSPASTALDLYCGAGTISLRMARCAGRVIGAEIVPEAIANAGENAERNGIRNAEFICADAGKAAQELAARGIQPEVIVVDPPRKGMDELAISSIAAMSPDRLVYVSCNPATLARDILRLNGFGYVLRAATAVDMFPRTSHVETVVLMSRPVELE